MALQLHVHQRQLHLAEEEVKRLASELEEAQQKVKRLEGELAEALLIHRDAESGYQEAFARQHQYRSLWAPVLPRPVMPRFGVAAAGVAAAGVADIEAAPVTTKAAIDIEAAGVAAADVADIEAAGVADIEAAGVAAAGVAAAGVAATGVADIDSALPRVIQGCGTDHRSGSRIGSRHRSVSRHNKESRPRPPPVAWQQYQAGWRIEGHPDVGRMRPRVSLELLSTSNFVICDALLRSQQEWNYDDVVICRIDFLIVSCVVPDHGFYGHLTLGYGSARMDSEGSLIDWGEHRTTEEYLRIKQHVKQSFEGNLLHRSIFANNPALDSSGKKVFFMVDSFSGQCLLRNWLHQVRDVLKLCETGWPHPMAFADTGRRWHLSVDGLAQRF